MMNHESVLLQMEKQIQAWEKSSDRRSIFLRCYALMTRSMLAAIEAGEFHDTGWVYALLNHFAEYYFHALEAYDHERATAPIVWTRVHEAAQDLDTLILQNLILGVNAHINYDLVLTLVDMLQTEWPSLDPQKRQMRYADHCHVNKIIGHTVDAVQDQVVETLDPKMDLVDKLFGPLDEWVISELIARWRDEVWDHAVAMLDNQDPQERERLRRMIETLTQERASAILLKGDLGDLAHFL
jgi:Family of unknown function (DUF5995)